VSRLRPRERAQTDQGRLRDREALPLLRLGEDCGVGLKVTLSHKAASAINLDIYSSEESLRRQCNGETDSPYFRVHLAYLNGIDRTFGKGEARMVELSREDAALPSRAICYEAMGGRLLAGSI
jgi:hypothetical protein